MKKNRERSASSTAVSSEVQEGAEDPAATDFDAFYPWLFARLHEREATSPQPSPPPAVLVRHVVRQEVGGRGSGKVRSTKANKSTPRLAAGGGELSPAAATAAPSDTAAGAGGSALSLVAVYDARERLVEVALGGGGGGGDAVAVPRVALRALTLSLTHQPTLARLTLRGELDARALREIGELLGSPAMTLTELRLDGSSLPHGDCLPLLESGRLRYLSLCRCRLDDADCAALAASLRARGRLAVLDLSSNRIGDEGAESLGALLRCDRYLRYLNLSDNRIGDVGCRALLGALAEFPLTVNELVAERRRRIAAATEPPRSKDKPAAIASSARTGRAGAAGATASGGDGQADARDTAPEPYARSQTLSRGGRVYCVGNSTICYLNLAYNELETWSVRRAAEAAGGLLRVVVEGNPLPPEGDDAAQLEETLERRLIDAVGAVAVDKRKWKK